MIDNKSGVPIYDQIYTQIKGHIISGELQQEQPLPSIRALAKDLRISVITTKRAYEELEKEGFKVTLLDVKNNHNITAQQVADAIREDTCLVTV